MVQNINYCFQKSKATPSNVLLWQKPKDIQFYGHKGGKKSYLESENLDFTLITV